MIYRMFHETLQVQDDLNFVSNLWNNLRHFFVNLIKKKSNNNQKMAISKPFCAFNMTGDTGCPIKTWQLRDDLKVVVDVWNNFAALTGKPWVFVPFSSNVFSVNILNCFTIDIANILRLVALKICTAWLTFNSKYFTE